MARERWDKRMAFIMAAVGSAIGLGNIWRFPYMAYSNGGGAFLIPYLIALVTTGVPLVALEYYLGVRYQKGPTEAYGYIRKKSKYIGWFSLGIAAMITFYYTVVMAWSWNFLFHSIKVSWKEIGASNFFYNNLLGLSDGISNLGGIQWPVLLGNLLTWIAIFFIVFKGVKVVGKVVKWTVGLPWLLLILIIIRGLTLDGALQGLEFYLKPNFEILKNPSVWLAAYGQIFFSLSLGFGVMIAYASYLPKKSDINTNAWVVSFANCSTSFFAGFAVFSVLGYLAQATGQPIDKVVGGGVGLAFVTFPTAIAQMPGGIILQAIFGIAFFFTLLTLGIDSAFSLVEAIVTGLKDSFNVKREKATFWVCLVGFIIGLIYCSKAGLYYLDVVDHWMNWGLVIVGFLEAVLIGWFYNTNKVSKDIDSTSEIKFGKIWVFSIKYLTPIILGAVIITSIYKEFSNPYGGYPQWALMSCGWILLISILYFAIYMQDRNNIKNISFTNSVGRATGWLLIFTGLLTSFVLFYQSTTLLGAITLIGSTLIGIFIITLFMELNNKKNSY